MFPPEKILFAVDFSERARTMAHAVRDLAKQCGAEVQLLHALELDPRDSCPEQMEKVSKKLDSLISKDLADCNVVVHLVPGAPASTIVDVARKAGADLIMMHTSGHGAFARALLGSVTARVLHDAPCPVWTSPHQKRPQAHPEHGKRTVLCAVDLSSRSSQVVQAAVQAAQLWEAQVRLTHVMELFHSSTKADWTRERRGEMTSSVEGQLRQLAEGAGGIPLVEVLEGSPAEKVIDAAKRFHADLIVVGRTEVVEDEADPKSTAYGILAGSHCPVLSV